MRALDALALARDTERIVNSVARKGSQEGKGEERGIASYASVASEPRWDPGGIQGNGEGGSLPDSTEGRLGGTGRRREKERDGAWG